MTITNQTETKNPQPHANNNEINTHAMPTAHNSDMNKPIKQTNKTKNSQQHANQTKPKKQTNKQPTNNGNNITDDNNSNNQQ